MPKTPYKLTALVFILEITNWHWILNYVCLGSQQNNIFSCSIGIFHVLEFSHFPFPFNFLAYIHSLSLSLSLTLSRSSHLMQQERNVPFFCWVTDFWMCIWRFPIDFPLIYLFHFFVSLLLNSDAITAIKCIWNVNSPMEILLSIILK